MPKTEHARVSHPDNFSCTISLKHNTTPAHSARQQTIVKSREDAEPDFGLSLAMQTSMLLAAKSDGTRSVDCLRAGQMNAALGAFDHGLGDFVGT